MTTVILLFAIGYALFFAELFVPGGILGVIGVLFWIIAAFVLGQRTEWWLGSASLGAAIALGALSFYLFFRTRASRWWVMSDSLPRGSSQEYVIQEGMTGVSLTDLRPAGKALFVLDGKEVRYEVLADSEWIAKDQSLRVVRTEGTKAIVTRS
jgi:membrane-bound serine protease (ClpP class)